MSTRRLSVPQVPLSRVNEGPLSPLMITLPSGLRPSTLAPLRAVAASESATLIARTSSCQSHDSVKETPRRRMTEPQTGHGCRLVGGVSKGSSSGARHSLQYTDSDK
jgi:hypothetical protein